MRVTWARAALMAVAVIATSVAARAAEEKGPQKVAPDKVPPAIKAAIQKEAKGADFVDVTTLQEDGKTVYWVIAVGEGKGLSLRLDADGKVLSRSVSEKLALDEAPPAVKATIEKEGEGLKVQTVVRMTVGEKTDYMADLAANKKEIRLQVDADGKLVSKEVIEEIALEQAPAAVKATILKEAKKGKVAEVRRLTEAGRTTFEAALEVNGKEVELTVDAQGTLLSRDVEGEEPAKEKE